MCVRENNQFRQIKCALHVYNRFKSLCVCHVYNLSKFRSRTIPASARDSKQLRETNLQTRTPLWWSRSSKDFNFCLVKTSFSGNFCQIIVRVNFRNFHNAMMSFITLQCNCNCYSVISNSQRGNYGHLQFGKKFVKVTVHSHHKYYS